MSIRAKSIRIVLADDHKVMRQVLSEAIQREDNMEVVGQAENGNEVVKLAEELRPDIIIMDIAMPELNGIEATRQILKNHPQIKVIALSMHANKRFMNEMLKAGAKRYLLKDCEYGEMINAIRSVITEGDITEPINSA